jgi:hypothetical protein
LRFRLRGLRFKAGELGLVLRVEGFGFRVQILGYGVWGLGFGV